MAQHDPNFPDTPTPPSGSSEELPQDMPAVPPLSDDAPDLETAEPHADKSPASRVHPTHVSTELFQQADLAGGFDAAIPQDVLQASETDDHESHVTDEVFQQADLAGGFDAAIPQDVLQASGIDDEPFVTDEVFQQADLAEPFDADSGQSSDLMLFDDDYSPHPTVPRSVVSEEIAQALHDTAFQVDEFGATAPLTATSDTPEDMIERSFDDLSLSEVVGLFWRQPRAIVGAVYQILTDTSDTASKKKAVYVPSADVNEQSRLRRGRVFQPDLGFQEYVILGLYLMSYVLALWGCLYFVGDNITSRQENRQLVGGFPYLVLAAVLWLFAEVTDHRHGLRVWVRSRRPANWLLMALRLIPLILWVWVVMRWMDASDEPVDQKQRVLDMITPTFPILLVGIAAWAIIEGLAWLMKTHLPAAVIPQPFVVDDDADPVDQTAAPIEPLFPILRWDDGPLPTLDLDKLNPVKISSAICGTLLALITWAGTSGNRMSDPIFYAWIASAVLWAIALSPDSWQPRQWLTQWHTRFTGASFLRVSPWVVLAVLGIAGLSVSMRLDRLYGDPMKGTRIPPEMTSDHVEKILDAQRILHGPSSPLCMNVPNCNRDIFFANNGGREPFQMYALAFIANLTGRDVDYNLLKTLALIESLLSLPIIGWFAWEILATENRRLRLTFALLAMGLVGVSFWHLNITRLALRIVLTPAITSLMLVYLSRAMRHNHRADFIKAGICLGVGLYMYQAVRMLPVVIVIGVVMAAYFGTRTWRERGRYAFNLAALVLMSFIIFVPMLHYTVENPDMFLRRTAGRLFGDDVISTQLADGTRIERRATLEEQLTAFQGNIPTLLSNMRNALLMFNWKGDVAWINNNPNTPALDPFVGALLVLGVAAWFSLAVRRGDVVYAFIPVVILVMLLPSALSIAYPIENPSFTRTSGALPAVFLLAAYPLAVGLEQINRLFYARWMRRLLTASAGLILIAAYSYSMSIYRTDFVRSYESSSLPYSQAGQILRGFAQSDGSYGNAFMVAYMYWWDHRAIGLEAGLTDWPNGIISRDKIPEFLRDAARRTDSPYRLDPLKDLIFFYNSLDLETQNTLKTWFPAGHETYITAYQAGDDFMIYRVPALGNDGFLTFLQKTAPN